MTDETRAQAIAALAQWLELSKPKRIATDIEHAAHGLAVESLAALRALPAAPRPDAGEAPDDRNRCAVCGWPLDPAGKMCRVGSCSMRPLPDRLYAPARAVAEYGTWAPLAWHQQAALTPSAPAAPGTPPEEPR